MAGRLADDIILEEILPRVPLNRLVRFKIVCKLWSKSISRTRLAKLQLCQHISLAPGSNYIPQIRSSSSHFYVNDPFPRETFVFRKILNMETTLLVACDGMLFLKAYEKDGSSSYIVFDPITLHYTVLPSPSAPIGRQCLFVFDECSNQYKILCWDSGKVSALTLGVGSSWRSLRNPIGYDELRDSPVLVNKKIYWTSFNRTTDRIIIFSMDIATEEIREIEAPGHFIMNYRFSVVKVMEINGFLHLLYYPGLNIGCRDIWIREDGEKQQWINLLPEKTQVHLDISCNCHKFLPSKLQCHWELFSSPFDMDFLKEIPYVNSVKRWDNMDSSCALYVKSMSESKTQEGDC